jgi:hypothetical protein
MNGSYTVRRPGSSCDGQRGSIALQRMPDEPEDIVEVVRFVDDTFDAIWVRRHRFSPR